jgi:hypothetical protein
MEFAVAVRRRACEPGRERAFGEEERTVGVLAGGLDEDLRRAGVMVLALSSAVEDRIHKRTVRRSFRFRLAAALDTEVGVRGQAAEALICKSVKLAELKRPDDEIKLYDELFALFADDPHIAMREHAAKAIVNRGVRLARIVHETVAAPVVRGR